jgi:hypothetical protein
VFLPSQLLANRRREQRRAVDRLGREGGGNTLGETEENQKGEATEDAASFLENSRSKLK